jgi:hypothetical protein
MIRRGCHLMLCLAACVFGCGRSTGGGPGDGGPPDQAVSDTPADEAVDEGVNDVSPQPDAGGQGAPCRTGADCAQDYQCVVLAAATACPSTPTGFCSYAPPSNCIVSADRCACFKNGPVQPDCSPFPNTFCDVVSDTDGGRCAACVPLPTPP